jgi:hypothetical protein
MLSTLLGLLRRSFGTAWQESAAARFVPPGQAAAAAPTGLASPDLIFRLRAWPQLPDAGRTADVYRMLSVMSSQPVNRPWLLARSRMAPQELDALLQHLVDTGALEVIDPARFAGREPCQA